MMSSVDLDDSNIYTFKYTYDNNYIEDYSYDYTSNLNKNENPYLVGLIRQSYSSHHSYPSNVTISLNKKKGWVGYIKRQINRLFYCFSLKKYSDIPDLNDSDF
jgi:hypothetical protein